MTLGSSTPGFAVLQNHYDQSEEVRILSGSSLVGIYPSLAIANHQAWISFRTTVWDPEEEGSGTETHPPEESEFQLLGADPCSWRTCDGDGRGENVQDENGALGLEWSRR